MYKISEMPPFGNGIKNNVDNNIKLPIQTEKKPFLTCEKLLNNPNKKIKKL